MERSRVRRIGARGRKADKFTAADKRAGIALSLVSPSAAKSVSKARVKGDVPYDRRTRWEGTSGSTTKGWPGEQKRRRRRMSKVTGQYLTRKGRGCLRRRQETEWRRRG